MRGYLETLTMPELRLDEATRGRYLTIISDETHRLERLLPELDDQIPSAGGDLLNSRYRHMALANLICRGVEQSGTNRWGLATRTTAH
jgi:hypothetical protein